MSYDENSANDNFRVHVSAKGREAFDIVFKLAAAGRKLEGYSIEGKGPKAELTFHWSKTSGDKAIEGVVPFPFEMDVEQAGAFAWCWLLSFKGDALPPEPDFDGSCSKGWHIDNRITHNGWRYGVLSVKFEWAAPHK